MSEELVKDPSLSGCEVDIECDSLKEIMYLSAMRLIQTLDEFMMQKLMPPFDHFHSQYIWMRQFIYSLSVEELPKDIRSTLSNAACDYIMILLQGISQGKEYSVSCENVLNTTWENYIHLIKILRLPTDIANKVVNQFIETLMGLDSPIYNPMMENILYKFYLFLELIDCTKITVSTSIAKKFFYNEEREIVRLYFLFVASLLTSEQAMAKDVPLTSNDVTVIVSDSHDLPFSKLQRLKFFRSMSMIECNRSLITAEDALKYITSVYESEDMVAEQEIASEILSCVFAESIESIDLSSSSRDEGNAAKITLNIEELVSAVMDDIALHAQEARDFSISDSDRGIRICLRLQEILTAISSDDSTSVVNSISAVPYAINVFCLFMKLHLEHIDGNCVAEYCSEIVLMAGNILVSATNEVQSTWQVVIYSGLANVLLGCLYSFSHQQQDENLLSKIDLILMLLHNCYSEFSKNCIFNAQGHEMAKALLFYMKSPNESVIFNAQTLLLNLHPFLIESDHKLLVVNTSRIAEILNGLRQAISSPFSNAVLPCGISFSLLEFVNFLRDAACIKQNIESMIQNEVLQILTSLTGLEDLKVVESSLLLIWSMSLHKDINEVIKMESDLITNLKSCPHKLGEIVLLSVDIDTVKDVSDLIKYAQECYDYKYYDECERVCSFLLHEVLNDVHARHASILSAKSIFKLYMNEKRLFSSVKDTLMPKELYSWKESMYQKVKKVINFLFKEELYQTDKELAMFLDVSMMECIQGDNRLHEVGRCMLCLKHCKKLIRSHIIPRSILENFRKSIARYRGNRIFKVSTDPEKYFTDKTLTRNLLCKDCESLLSTGGEQDFSEKFFKEIYKLSDPDSLSLANEIQYGTWLYHFFIGFLFRGIAAFAGIPNVVNDEEVYELFIIFRKLLLKQALLPSEVLPNLHMFINPTSPPSEYKTQWNHATLVGPASFHMSSNQLSDENASHCPKVHFIMAKIGIITVIVKLSPALNTELSMTSVISPSFGKFKIAADEERSLLLPKGVKDLYTKMSLQSRKEFQDSIFRRDKFAPIPNTLEVDMDIQHKRSFMLSKAIDLDKLEFQEKIEVDGGLFLKCLPHQFKLDEKKGEVHFPTPFVKVLHYRLELSDQNYAITLFVGISQMPSKAAKPFIIYYEAVEKQILCFGYTFNLENYTVNEYISEIAMDEYPESIAKRIQELCEHVVPHLIPAAVEKCGFSDVKSLMYHYQHNNMERNFDMKCSEKSCWYCKNLCDNCLKPAAFDSGYQATFNSDLLLKFCGNDCKEKFICSETEFEVIIQLLPFRTVYDGEYVPKGHRELFRIQGHIVFSKDQVINFNLSVRMDQESKYYAIYSENQNFVRKYFEIFISSTGHFISFLPHTTTERNDQDLVLFDYLSVHMEAGLLLSEKYQEGPLDSVILPIGVDSGKDPFFENSCCFPKQNPSNKWKIVLNSLCAYKLLIQLKDQEELMQHIVGIAVNQLQSIQVPAYHAGVEVFDISKEIVCEIISGLTQITPKSTKVLLSGLVLSLWNAVISDEPFSTEMDEKLFDTLLTYLKLRQEAIQAIQQPSRGIGIADVPVFHILHHMQVKPNNVVSMVQSLEPFIRHRGAFRWAALLTLASVTEHLPDLQILRLLDIDIQYMNKYLMQCSDEDQCTVMKKFQSFLLLPDNRVIMNEKGLIQQLASLCDAESGFQRRVFLKNLIDAYETSAT